MPSWMIESAKARTPSLSRPVTFLGDMMLWGGRVLCIGDACCTVPPYLGAGFTRSAANINNLVKIIAAKVDKKQPLKMLEELEELEELAESTRKIAEDISRQSTEEGEKQFNYVYELNTPHRT